VQREIRRHTTYTSIRHTEEYIYRDLALISTFFLAVEHKICYLNRTNFRVFWNTFHITDWNYTSQKIWICGNDGVGAHYKSDLNISWLDSRELDWWDNVVYKKNPEPFSAPYLPYTQCNKWSPRRRRGNWRRGTCRGYRRQRKWRLSAKTSTRIDIPTVNYPDSFMISIVKLLGKCSEEWGGGDQNLTATSDCDTRMSYFIIL